MTRGDRIHGSEGGRQRGVSSVRSLVGVLSVLLLQILVRSPTVVVDGLRLPSFAGQQRQQQQPQQSPRGGGFLKLPMRAGWLMVTRGGGFNCKRGAGANDDSRRCGGGNILATAFTRIRGGAGEPNALVEGLKNGCASGLAAACAKLVLQPFDTVKTLQQANIGSLGMFEAGKAIVAKKGIGALYTGLGVTLVGSIPAVSVYFGVYQASKKAMLQALPKTLAWSLLGVAASAAIGNTVASVFRVPYEVVKQRLQAGVYSTTREALTTMYKEGGLFAFFGKGGVASQILRDVPYAIVTLLTYESLRRTRAELRKGQPSSPWEDSAIGAIAGGIGSLISNPMDVVKTRIMTQPQLYQGVWDAIGKIWLEEGPTAFLKGTAPRLLHKVPANAIFFATYEIFRALLQVQS